MKRSPQAPRTVANLSESVRRQLNMYALAATAAGVSALALAQPAEAKIVYTPAHVKLVGGQPFALDLNHDGKVDFYLFHYYWAESSDGANDLRACDGISTNTHGKFCSVFSSDGLNAIRVIESMGRSWGAALRPGAKIQRVDRFENKQPIILGLENYAVSNPRWYGPWANYGKGVKNRYLGMKFKINDRFHFGWARLTFTTTKDTFTAILTGYAYETIPGKAIVAGKTKGPDVVVEPATLGHLAQGAASVSSWLVKPTAAPPTE
jgi:hypothetical protein